MGSLRDQFEKAKLLSAKDAKRIAHEQRVERKEKGRDELERERAEREAALRGAVEAERQRDRERQREVEAARVAAQERAACESLLEREARAVSRGPMSWMFELEDGRLPVLRISEIERVQLTSGQVCIVRRKPGDAHVYGLIATAHAQRVARCFPERIAWAAKGALTR